MKLESVCVCVCVCVCVFMHWTGDWKCTGLEVCVNMQKYIYKIGQVDDGRLEGAGRIHKKRGRHTSSYMYLLYVDVSYPPANPDA